MPDTCAFSVIPHLLLKTPRGDSGTIILLIVQSRKEAQRPLTNLSKARQLVLGRARTQSQVLLRVAGKKATPSSEGLVAAEAPGHLGGRLTVRGPSLEFQLSSF